MGRKKKKTRAPRGGGTIFQSKTTGLWIGRVPVSQPGSRMVYRERQAKTLEELRGKLATLRPLHASTTVKEWYSRWLDSLSVRSSTRADYRHTFEKFVLPALGTTPLRDLTPFHIEAVAQRWGKPVGPLGPNTLRKNLVHMATCLEAARRAKLITENPATDARKPRKKKVAIDPLSPVELACVIRACAEPRLSVFALLASTGMRLGEALALDVSNYDQKLHTLSILRTYTKKHGLRPPKSENGVRTIRVPTPALSSLLGAIDTRRSGPLFLSRLAGRRQHSAVRRSWGSLLKRLGIRYRNPHQLRHSVATAMIASGVALPDIARYLGCTVDVLVKTYIHPAGQDPSLTMDRLLGGELVGKGTTQVSNRPAKRGKSP